jgi:hypothetical protein
MIASHQKEDASMIRRALTITEVIFVLLGLALLCVVCTSLFPFSWTPRGESSRRVVCAANLKQIANGMMTYAMANNGSWPVPAHMPADAEEIGRVTYAPGNIGIRRGPAGQPEAGKSTDQDAALSTTRAFWELIRTGYASPKLLICPASVDEPNDEKIPQDFWDFRKYNEISYGYQVPFGKHGRASERCDPEMALAADKGPYSAALEAAKPHPGVPTATIKSAPEQWALWNSPNHDGEGQNAVYNDGHVEYSVMTPLAGWKKDNIYTRWSRADADKDENELARVQGTPPTGIETPWGDTDSLIYP